MEITAETIRAALWQLQVHLNMGSKGHSYSYRCPSIPELTRSERTLKGKYIERVLWVGETAIPFPPMEPALDEAARLINLARRDKVDGKAWAEAAPKTEDAA